MIHPVAPRYLRAREIDLPRNARARDARASVRDRSVARIGTFGFRIASGSFGTLERRSARGSEIGASCFSFVDLEERNRCARELCY